MDKTAENMRKGLIKLLEAKHLPYHVVGVGSFFHIDWTEKDVTNYRTAATEDRQMSRVFSTELMNRGIFMWGHPNVSAVTTANDVKIALEAVEKSLDSMFT
jgi:glutamate-1-semialdehyde aminotransferase